MYADLFFSFLQVGLFSFGGGMVSITLLMQKVVIEKAWITAQTFNDLIAIAESTPGPIAINCATFTGYKQAGFVGSLAATIGMVLPSFLIIYLISMFLDNFLELTLVANAFKGIKIAVGILILDAAFTMSRKMHKKMMNLSPWRANWYTCTVSRWTAMRSRMPWQRSSR